MNLLEQVGRTLGNQLVLTFIDSLKTYVNVDRKVL